MKAAALQEKYANGAQEEDSEQRSEEALHHGI